MFLIENLWHLHQRVNFGGGAVFFNFRILLSCKVFRGKEHRAALRKKPLPFSTQIWAPFNSNAGNLAGEPIRAGYPDGCARFLRHGAEFWPLNTLRLPPNWLQLLRRNSRCALFGGFGADLDAPSKLLALRSEWKLLWCRNVSNSAARSLQRHQIMPTRIHPA